MPRRRRVSVSPDLLPRLFVEVERHDCSLGLCGGSGETLPDFTAFVAEPLPRLQVPFVYAPRSRSSLPRTTRRPSHVRSARVHVLFVGLGRAKRDYWIGEHKERLACVTIGGGAAVDRFGDHAKRTLRWTRTIGLECSSD